MAVTEAQKQQFVATMAPYAQQWSAQTGIPPEVFIAIGASESNWGSTGTLFGIKGSGTAGSKAYDTFEVVNGQRVPMRDSFAVYNNPDEAFQHFVNLVSNGRYSNAWQGLQNSGDWQGFLSGLQRAGYATDPNWPRLIAGLSQDVGGRLMTMPPFPTLQKPPAARAPSGNPQTGGVDEFGFPIQGGTTPPNQPGAGGTTAPAAPGTQDPNTPPAGYELVAPGVARTTDPATGRYIYQVFNPTAYYDLATGGNVPAGWRVSGALPQQAATEEPQAQGSVKRADLEAAGADFSTPGVALLPDGQRYLLNRDGTYTVSGTPAAAKSSLPQGAVTADALARAGADFSTPGVAVVKGQRYVQNPDGTYSASGTPATTQQKQSPLEQVLGSYQRVTGALNGGSTTMAGGQQGSAQAQPQGALAQADNVSGGGSAATAQPPARGASGDVSPLNYSAPDAFGRPGSLGSINIALPGGGSQQVTPYGAARELLDNGLVPSGDPEKDMEALLGARANRATLMAMNPNMAPADIQTMIDASTLGTAPDVRRRSLAALADYNTANAQGQRLTGSAPKFTPGLTLSGLADLLKPTEPVYPEPLPREEPDFMVPHAKGGNVYVNPQPFAGGGNVYATPLEQIHAEEKQRALSVDPSSRLPNGETSVGGVRVTAEGNYGGNDPFAMGDYVRNATRDGSQLIFGDLAFYNSPTYRNQVEQANRYNDAITSASNQLAGTPGNYPSVNDITSLAQSIWRDQQPQQGTGGGQRQQGGGGGGQPQSVGGGGGGDAAPYIDVTPSSSAVVGRGPVYGGGSSAAPREPFRMQPGPIEGLTPDEAQFMNGGPDFGIFYDQSGRPVGTYRNRAELNDLYERAFREYGLLGFMSGAPIQQSDLRTLEDPTGAGHYARLLRNRSELTGLPVWRILEAIGQDPGYYRNIVNPKLGGGLRTNPFGADTTRPFAEGGSMMLPEPVIGMGAHTGTPYFTAAENRPEMLTFTPTNAPAYPAGMGLPTGGMPAPQLAPGLSQRLGLLSALAASAEMVA